MSSEEKTETDLKVSFQQMMSLLRQRFGPCAESETINEYITRIASNSKLAPYRHKLFTIVERVQFLLYGEGSFPGEVCTLKRTIDEICSNLLSLKPPAKIVVDKFEPRTEPTKARNVVRTEVSPQPEKSAPKRVHFRIDVRKIDPRSLSIYLYSWARQTVFNFFNYFRKSPLIATYLVTITAVALAIRFHLFFAYPSGHDEANGMLNSFYIFKSFSRPELFWRYGAWAIFNSGFEICGNSHPPLYMLLAAVLFALNGGPSLLLFRLPNLAAGILLVSLLFFVSKKIYESTMAGVFASSFGATYPFLVFWTSASTKFYILAADFMLLSAYFLLQGLEHHELRSYVISGIFAGLALLTSMECIGIFPGVLLFFCYKEMHLHMGASMPVGICAKTRAYFVRIYHSIFQKYFGIWLLCSSGLFLPQVLTAAYLKYIVQSPFQTYFDWFVSLSGQKEIAQHTQSLTELAQSIVGRWIFNYGAWWDGWVPFGVKVFFSAAILFALIKPSIGDRLFLSLFFVWAGALSVIRFHGPWMFLPSPVFLIIICSGFLEKLSQLLIRFSGHVRARYLFWIFVLAVLIAPNLIGVPNLLSGPYVQSLVSQHFGTSTSQQMAQYIAQNYPHTPVVLVDMSASKYSMMAILAMYEKNDIYQANFDPVSNSISIEPEWTYYWKPDLTPPPKNFVQGDLVHFLYTLNRSCLFVFAEHEESYNDTMRCISQHHVSMRLIHQWDYYYDFVKPVKLYLVSPYELKED